MPTIRQTHDAFQDFIDGYQQIKSDASRRRAEVATARHKLASEIDAPLTRFIADVITTADSPAIDTISRLAEEAQVKSTPAARKAELEAEHVRMTAELTQLVGALVPGARVLDDDFSTKLKLRLTIEQTEAEVRLLAATNAKLDLQTAKSAAQAADEAYRDFCKRDGDLAKVRDRFRDAGVPDLDRAEAQRLLHTDGFGAAIKAWLTNPTYRKVRSALNDYAKSGSDFFDDMDQRRALGSKAEAAKTAATEADARHRQSTKAEAEASKLAAATIKSSERLVALNDKLLAAPRKLPEQLRAAAVETLKNPAVLERAAREYGDRFPRSVIVGLAKAAQLQRLEDGLDAIEKSATEAAGKFEPHMTNLRKGKRNRPSKSISIALDQITTQVTAHQKVLKDRLTGVSQLVPAIDSFDLPKNKLDEVIDRIPTGPAPSTVSSSNSSSTTRPDDSWNLLTTILIINLLMSSDNHAANAGALNLDKAEIGGLKDAAANLGATATDLANVDAGSLTGALDGLAGTGNIDTGSVDTGSINSGVDSGSLDLSGTDFGSSSSSDYSGGSSYDGGSSSSDYSSGGSDYSGGSSYDSGSSGGFDGGSSFRAPPRTEIRQRLR